MKQKIIVTALPNGVTKTRMASLKLSASISLQVEEINTTLNNVKDMLNWTDLVKSAKFSVEYNGKLIPAEITGTAIDVSLWHNLFTPTVKVSAFKQEELHNMPIASYPVKHVLDFLKMVTEQTGKIFSNELPDSTNYTENPVMTAISDYGVGPFPQRGRERLSLDKLVIEKKPFGRLAPILNKNKFIPFSATASPTLDFAQLKNFHGLYNKKGVKNYVPIEKPDFEFHAILSVLASHPHLQRKLGLVIDLEFAAPPDTILPAAIKNSIRVIPSGIAFSDPTTIVCPATEFIKTSSGFFAKPEAGSMIDKGHIRINTEAFTVFQLDTDGAALKLCQQVDALQLKKAKHIFYAAENYMPNAATIPLFANEAPRKEGLPSHRSAGIGIARNGMAEKLNKKFNRMNDLKTSMATGKPAPAGVVSGTASYLLPDELLSADDINLGYRFDIQPDDQGGKWFSLHKRVNTYSYINSIGKNVPITGMNPDEGFIQLSATEETTDTGPQLKVGEAIARWEGWSLSVPRPGSALNDPLNDKTNEVYSEKTGNKSKEEDKYKTPITSDFKLNVLPVIVKESLPKLRFGRRYALKIRTVDLAGNSTDLNSNPENAADCLKQAVKYFRYEPVDAPFLVLANTLKDGESGEVMVIRSNEGITPEQFETNNKLASLPAPWMADAVRHVKPPRTTVEMATTHGMLDAAMGATNAAKALEFYNFIKDNKDPAFSNTKGMYEMKVESSSSKTLNVEYLTDPLAVGASFFLASSDPNPEITAPASFDNFVSFYFDTPASPKLVYDVWMKPNTFRIRLTEGDRAIKWLSSDRTLLVTLPKGTMLKLNYSCFWNTSDLADLSGILDIMNASTLSDQVKQRIAKGQHWMFSPWRELTLVHATQQPLSMVGVTKVPRIDKIESRRDFGDNFTLLDSKFLVHGPSTGKLDIEAAWTEWDDDITKPKWQEVPMRSKVFQFSTMYFANEYVFGELVKNNPFHGVKHVFGDTKHRTITYKTIATTRYRENFTALIAEKKDAFVLTREGNEVVANILSSARPVAPDVAYVVPTFEWDRITKGNITISGRACGLRIYVKRPWYSSGEGEQLAVVLHMPALPMKADAPGSGNTPVTTWGTDPTKYSSDLPVNTNVTQENFWVSDPKNKDQGLTATDNPLNRVNIIAVDPKYDEERHLFYFDILPIIGNAYYPFMRLALARYQRDSLRKTNEDCCLSPVVRTDYIQVPPPRGCSLEFKGSKNEISIGISGTLPSYGTSGSAFFTRFDFIIEPININPSENIHISLDEKPIMSDSYVVRAVDLKNFTFQHFHPFSLPAQYATKPYRVKIMEYEMIEVDRFKPKTGPALGSMPVKDRLVFSEVYEVNK